MALAMSAAVTTAIWDRWLERARPFKKSMLEGEELLDYRIFF